MNRDDLQMIGVLIDAFLSLVLGTKRERETATILLLLVALGGIIATIYHYA